MTAEQEFEAQKLAAENLHMEFENEMAETDETLEIDHDLINH
jgi:hypothetical protein